MEKALNVLYKQTKSAVIICRPAIQIPHTHNRNLQLNVHIESILRRKNYLSIWTNEPIMLMKDLCVPSANIDNVRAYSP